jgi:hypothetical protein
MRYTEPLVAAENFERAHLDGRHAIRAAPKSMIGFKRKWLQPVRNPE